jgi:hypothetical protein
MPDPTPGGQFRVARSAERPEGPIPRRSGPRGWSTLFRYRARDRGDADDPPPS